MQKVLLAAFILMGLAVTAVLAEVPAPTGAGGPDWDRVYAGP
jgi:hypothetical protein